MENRPDAIFIAADSIITTTLGLLKELKLKVPQDVALLGFNNAHLAHILNPPLSALVQPGFEIGKAAMEMLITLIESKRPVTEFETKILPTELFIRESSTPVK